MEYEVKASSKNAQKWCNALMPSMIKQLGLENSSKAVVVMIDPLFADTEGITLDMGIEGLDCYLIALKPYRLSGKTLTMGHKEMALSLAHEMVHVKQMAKGQLKTTSRGTKMWMGKKYPSSTKYLDQPWEVEAFSRQELIMRRAIEE